MKWNADPAHSQIDFRVRSMGIGSVRGGFDSFTFSAESGDNGALTGIEATIEAGSINTGGGQRDDHLKSADFLDVENHPQLSFRSSQVDALGDGKYRVTGDLSIRGDAKPITLEVETSEPINDLYGNSRVAASATGTFNRMDWGLIWNQVLEAGALLVGEEVRITIDVQGIVEG